MKKILTIAVLALSTSLSAQKLEKKQAARFKTDIIQDSMTLEGGGKVFLYHDNSQKVRFLGQLYIANMEYITGNVFKASVGVSADVLLKKYLSFHAQYSRTFVDVERLINRMGSNTNYSLTYIKVSQPWEIGARVNLIDKQSKKTRRIILESKTYRSGSRTMGGRDYDTHTTINYYIKTKLPNRNILALRGGYLANNAIVSTDMNKDSKVITQNGTELGTNYVTNSYLRGGYAGIANLVIFSSVTKNTLKRGSVFESKAVNELYADILYGKTTFDAIIDSNGRYDIVADAPGSFQTSPIGARIGIINSKENRGTTSTKLEVGYRPGIKGKGFFVNIGMSIALIK